MEENYAETSFKPLALFEKDKTVRLIYHYYYGDSFIWSNEKQCLKEEEEY